ncbi:hypothetical protein JG687_00018563 [Phytophthora cactorum]|uniref:BED-type domain-containing protein n=1 Tax=Phytophthora cactorum TaxID=29920 RepID=A0A8T1TME8_9STRA|nr:hypothetical protein JG687_00018563 [Phytophthora cactorum]
MPSSPEICAFFFEEGVSYHYTCKVCNGGRKQAPSTGYSNLLSHLATKHPDYLTEMATTQRAERGTIESSGFVSESVGHLFRWILFIVMRNHSLCEVDDPLTRSILCTCSTSSKRMKLMMQLVAVKQKCLSCDHWTMTILYGQH